MSGTLTFTLQPEVLAALAAMQRDLRDIRDLLSRIGWNAAARRDKEQDTRPEGTPTGVRPAVAEGQPSLNVTQPAGERDGATTAASRPHSEGEGHLPESARSPAPSGPAPSTATAHIGPGMRLGMRFSEERLAVVRREYPRGTEVRAIAAACALLPGPEVTATHVYATAARLGLSRPAWTPDSAAPASIAPKPAAPAPAQLPSATPPRPARAAPEQNGPVVVDLAQLRAWAAVRGIAVNGPDDLKHVNAKAVAVGLPLFALRDPALRRAG